jgi:hypothetical protein
VDEVFEPEALTVSGWADIPVARVVSHRRPRRVAAQFTQVSLPHMAAAARCRTGRAAALYLLVVRQSQLARVRAERAGKEPVAGVRIATPDLQAAGMHDERAMRRATHELVELGLVRRTLRPGRASLLEILSLPDASSATEGV